MLKSIITPMNFTLVRDAICQHIANERDNQIQLAQKSQAEENWIEQNIGFTIFPKRLRVPNVYELPCVYIYFNEATFPQVIYKSNITPEVLPKSTKAKKSTSK